VEDFVFWDMMLFSLVEVYRCFGRTCCLHLQIKERIGFLVSKVFESVNAEKSSFPAENKVLADITIKISLFWDVKYIVW
jgi:hypothetical protein